MPWIAWAVSTARPAAPTAFPLQQSSRAGHTTLAAISQNRVQTIEQTSKWKTTSFSRSCSFSFNIGSSPGPLARDGLSLLSVSGTSPRMLAWWHHGWGAPCTHRRLYIADLLMASMISWGHRPRAHPRMPAPPYPTIPPHAVHAARLPLVLLFMVP